MWNDFWDTGGGSLIGMGCHYTDIAQWGHNSDDTGPIDYEGEATFNPDSFSEMPITAEIRCTYADGVRIALQSRGAFADRFIRFVGADGWIQVDDETNKITAQPESILKQRSISARSWAHVGDHVRNFLDCIKTREQTTCPPEAAHRATTIGHAANLCIRLGRKLTWDPQRELFDDGDANSMISRAMRAPWHL
jgi:predicted dehydrogenase